MKKIFKALLKLILFLVIVFGAFYLLVYDYLYPMNYQDEILKYSEENDLDPYLVYAIINVESNFNPKVKSNANAKGLMQIMDITADWAKEHIELEELAEEDYYKPEINIKIGCWYLSKLSKIYNGNIIEIAAAYNAGTGNVDSWIIEGKDVTNGEIPFKETEKYVQKVLSNIEVYNVLYGDNNSKKDAANAFVKIIDLIFEKISNRTSKMMKTK